MSRGNQKEIAHTEEGIMANLTIFSETRTYTVEELVPADVLAQMGEPYMTREFHDMIKDRWPFSLVDGWTVTARIKTDDDDEEFAREKIANILNNMPAECQKRFS